jgi:DNA-binding transcriptional regulator YiaG
MKYNSEIQKAMHQEAVEMYKIGVITEARMREYDEMCLSNPKKEKKSSSVYTDDTSVKHKQMSHATA